MGAIFSYFFPVETTSCNYKHAQDFLKMYEPLPIESISMKILKNKRHITQKSPPPFL